VAEQRFRAKAKMKFPHPIIAGWRSAPALSCVGSDMRWVNAFPVFNDGVRIWTGLYKENAERILLQSCFAARRCRRIWPLRPWNYRSGGHGIGQEEAQTGHASASGHPDEISVLESMLYSGACGSSPYKRYASPWRYRRI